MQILDQVVQLWRELSPSVFAILSIASAVATLAFVGYAHRFSALRPHGVTVAAGSILLNALVLMAFLSIGINAITIFRGQVPEWISVGIPATIATVSAVVILYKLMWRPTFTWQRYWTAIGINLAVPLLPLGSLLPQVLQVA